MTRNCSLKAISAGCCSSGAHSRPWPSQTGTTSRTRRRHPRPWPSFAKANGWPKTSSLDEAIAAYRQAIPSSRIMPRLISRWAWLMPAGNRYPEAVKAFKEAARLQPQWGQVYENLGVAYIKMGQWREARDAFAEAIRLHPDNAEAHYNLGLANGKLNRDQEARAQFAEAIRLDPAMAKAHKNLGLAYLNLGMLDQARKSLQEAVRLDPKDPQAHYALCVYYARAGDTQAANREFQALKSLDPKLAGKLTDLMRPGAPAEEARLKHRGVPAEPALSILQLD